MAYSVHRSRASNRDLELIFDHLFAAYTALDDGDEEALERAATRVRAIEDDIEALGRMPHQGTLYPELLPGLRRLTRHSAVFYFTIAEAALEVRVLAVFFGGQDHQRRMLLRLA